MLLNSHISAYTRCLAEKVCGLMRSTWGSSQGEDKLGARDKILNKEVARRARAGQTFPRDWLILGLGGGGSCTVLPYHPRVAFFGVSHWTSPIFPQKSTRYPYFPSFPPHFLPFFLELSPYPPSVPCCHHKQCFFERFRPKFPHFPNPKLEFPNLTPFPPILPGLAYFRDSVPLTYRKQGLLSPAQAHLAQ